jgi:hypothetical protein
MAELSIGGLTFLLALVTAIVCARWAMELGFSQLGQVLWGLAGLFAGPIVLLILYVRLLRATGGPARRWF